jgi:hypothetical protein
MTCFPRLRHFLLACLVMLSVLACNAAEPLVVSEPVSPTAIASSPNTTTATPVDRSDLPAIIREDGTIRVEPLAVDPALRNEWPQEMEDAFWERANQVIQDYVGKGYGNTFEENEKRSYPIAMFDVLGGDRDKALKFLESDDAQAKDHEQTEGIDYYFCFTLKNQIRKYFFFGKWLDPDYRQRMFEGAKRWTEQDPVGRPHPIYGNGSDSGGDWSMERRGGWVDGRNTDNLRAMREVAVYLMAEETGNEETRQQYKEKIQRYVGSLYTIGMGEWDSANYHGHTFSAYLNLYDFAKDPEVKRLGKAALDWLSAAAAMKYYHDGWAGPTKRDASGTNVVFGSAAANFFWQYFGDASRPNPNPERDIIHIITSAYRPPLAVMALAQKTFDRPVEILSTKPRYETWKSDATEAPAFWETTFVGQTYQMGSVVSESGDGDVGPFKLLADNNQHGVDFFVANTKKNRVAPGKNSGDQIGQYRNLLIWLNNAENKPFVFQLPQTAQIEVENGVWFVELEKTWLAIHPIQLNPYESVEPSDSFAEDYPEEQTLKAKVQDDRYAGFALEVGEPPSHNRYSDFKRAVQQRSRLDLSAIAQGTVQLTSSTGTTLRLTYDNDSNLPTVVRNGTTYDWSANLDLYRPSEGDSPISLGWKQGTLQVKADGQTFETTLGSDRLVH